MLPPMPDRPEPMDVATVVDKLRDVLTRQHRSTLQYTMLSGTVVGFENQYLAGRMWSFALAELEDTRRLTEKLTALGGDPPTTTPDLHDYHDLAAGSQVLSGLGQDASQAKASSTPGRDSPYWRSGLEPRLGRHGL